MTASPSRIIPDSMDMVDDGTQQIPAPPPLSLLERAPLEFILICGDLLQLPRPVLSTTFTYYNRYQAYYKVLDQIAQVFTDDSDPAILQRLEDDRKTKLDDYLIATTALHLSIKSHDLVRKLRDVINVAYHSLHPEEPVLSVGKNGDKYYKLRDTVLQAELLLLRILNFNTHVELPYEFVPLFLAYLVRSGEVGGVEVKKDERRERDYDRRDRERRRRRRSRSRSRSQNRSRNQNRDHYRRPSRVQSKDHNPPPPPPPFTLTNDLIRFIMTILHDTYLHPKLCLFFDAKVLALSCIFIGIKLFGRDEGGDEWVEEAFNELYKRKIARDDSQGQETGITDNEAEEEEEESISHPEIDIKDINGVTTKHYFYYKTRGIEQYFWKCYYAPPIFPPPKELVAASWMASSVGSGNSSSSNGSNLSNTSSNSSIKKKSVLQILDSYLHRPPMNDNGNSGNGKKNTYPRKSDQRELYEIVMKCTKMVMEFIQVNGRGAVLSSPQSKSNGI